MIELHLMDELATNAAVATQSDPTIDSQIRRGPRGRLERLAALEAQALSGNPTDITSVEPHPDNL